MVYQIPPFLMGQAANIDFSPVQNALAQWRQGQQQNIQNALARENLNWHRENALSQRQMDQKKLDWEMSKFDQTQEGVGPLRLAQAEKEKAHAAWLNAQAKYRFADPPPQMRQPTIGQREDGSLYEMDAGEGTVDTGEPRVERRVLGDSSSMQPGMSREHSNYGPYGQTPQNIPGIVVDLKGRTDRPATREAQGQRAADAMPDADRERFLKGQQNQRLWTGFYGRPPRPGHMYDQQGREVPVGPLSNSADQQERKDRAIRNMLTQIGDAEKTLTGSWNVTRSVAKGLDELGTFGRFIQPQSMEKLNAAFGQYQEGVLQTVYALSGKQTTNKEMEAFLGLYMPRPGESDDRIKEKSLRLKKMLSTLQSSIKKGMVYDEAERFAIDDASNADFGKNQERLAPSNPANARLKSKYGLE